MSQPIVIDTGALLDDAQVWEEIEKHAHRVPPEVSAACDRAVQEAIAAGELEQRRLAQNQPRLPTGRIE